MVVEEKAVDHLTARNLVQRGGVATYEAGQSITLQPGFTAQAGAVFEASIRPVQIRPGSAEAPGTLTVSASPNPFDLRTEIRYHLPEATKVTRTLSNTQGQVLTVDEGQDVQRAGTHRTQLDASQLPAGVYLYEVKTGRERKVIRLLKK